MADTIAVMNHGVIEQMGAPGELYENPQTTFVANFLGQSNLIMTEVTGSSNGTILVDCHGQKVGVGADRSRRRSSPARLARRITGTSMC